MKINKVDAFLIILAVVAVVATILNFFTVRGPEAAVQDFSIREIPTPPAVHDRGI